MAIIPVGSIQEQDLHEDTQWEKRLDGEKDSCLDSRKEVRRHAEL